MKRALLAALAAAALASTGCASTPTAQPGQPVDAVASLPVSEPIATTQRSLDRVVK
jgi:hypothetical protein